MGAKVETRDNRINLNIDYHPSPIAQDFIEDPTYITGFFGPLGCGKTTAGTLKAFMYSMAWPGARIAVIRDTYPNLLDTTQKTFFEWLPEGIAGTYVKSTRNFYLQTTDPNRPAEIMFRAMDQKDDVTNVLSLDLAAAWIDEPQGGLNLTSNNLTREPGLDHALVQLLQARLGRQSGYPPMMWMTGNPPAPSHWIAQDFQYDGRGLPKNPDPLYRLYLGTQDTNRAHLTDQYYERLERLFGKNTPLARRFLTGEWIEFAQMNPFHASWIRYYGETEDEKVVLNDEFLKSLVIEIGFDPAISKNDTSAQSALVVGGQVRKGINRGRIYILEARAGHWSVYEQVAEIIRTARRYKARAVRIEDVAYQRALKEVLEHELRQTGLSLFIDAVPPDGDKLRRANAWSHWVEDGTVVFPRSANVLIKCMLSVPGDKNAWDLVDAAGICVRGFPALQGEVSKLDRDNTISYKERAIGYTKTQDLVRPIRSLGPRKHPKRRAVSYFNHALVG